MSFGESHLNTVERLKMRSGSSALNAGTTSARISNAARLSARPEGANVIIREAFRGTDSPI